MGCDGKMEEGGKGMGFFTGWFCKFGPGFGGGGWVAVLPCGGREDRDGVEWCVCTGCRFVFFVGSRQSLLLENKLLAYILIYECHVFVASLFTEYVRKGFLQGKNVIWLGWKD